MRIYRVTIGSQSVEIVSASAARALQMAAQDLAPLVPDISRIEAQVEYLRDLFRNE